METLASYDQLPYDRLPLPETEPDFLVALARLHGFEAADPVSARVLELGCAQGGNLIPLAARYPHSEFIGVDLSRVQVEEGQAFVSRVGLTNIRLLHGDIAGLPDDLGEFDFIIAHGVYSWVPDGVREALLATCRRRLKPQGIAYISFNVEAGWRLYSRIRNALLEQDDAGVAPMQRVSRAQSTLAAMQKNDARLAREIAYLKTASPSYLFHEYLSEINQPFSFEAFVGSAARHSLRYLGEAGPRRARVALENDWGLSAEVRHERWLEAEARLDEAVQTRFRRALLVRDEAEVPGPPAIEHLPRIAFSAQLGCDEELDFAESGTQYFQSPTGERYPVSHPLLKAYLVVLASAWPAALPYPMALAQALPLAHEYGYTGDADADFMETLLDVVQLHAVRLHTRAGTVVADETSVKVSRLAQIQAGTPGWPVTTAAHQALDLDEWGRWLLTVMDGTVSQAELAGQMAQRLADVGIRVETDQPAQFVAGYLTLFRQHGILAG